MTTADLDRLAAAVDSAVLEALGPARTVALVSFPNHGNPGDPAIWLGARAVLRRLGVRVAYRSSWRTFDPAALRRAVPAGAPVLLNGGGNFGDLYPGGQQATRERVLRVLRERPVVQLPQSIHFDATAERDRVGGLLRDHGRVHLILREQRSLDLARQHFPEVTSSLGPDLVLGLGPLQRPGPPRHDVVWLLRQDKEGIARGEVPLRPVDRQVDWLDQSQVPRGDGRPLRLARRVNDRLHPVVGQTPGPAGRLWRPLAWTFEPLARDWLRGGLDVVCAGRVLVTDTLHGHVFATLAGVPHVVLDNSYGKVRATFETWTGELGVGRWADSLDEARGVADDLLAGPR